MINVENNMYKVIVTKVLGLNKSTKALRFEFAEKKQATDFTFFPGQYLMVGVPGYGEAPLTITTSSRELPEFEIAVRSVGDATKALHRLKIGDSLYARGPFGNNIMSDNIYGKDLILIAGGLGLAPLRSIIHHIRDDSHVVGSLTIICGAKSPEDLLFKAELDSWKEFADVHLVVDKADRGWTGEVGRVIDILDKLKISAGSVAVVCGPPVMYPGIAEALLSQGVAATDIQLMLERRMKCGIGKCQHCTCGEKYVCKDGPTFTWAEIINNPEALR